MITKREIIFVPSIILLVLLATKWNVINIPFYWDEMGIYVEPLKRLSEDFSYLTNLRGFFDHPPGLQLLVYPFYKLSGDAVWMVRLYALLMSALTLSSIYFIGLRFGSRVFSFTIAAVLFLTPEFYAQSNLFLGDNTVSGIMLLYLLLATNSKWKWAIFLGLLAGICRESSLAFGVGIFVFWAWQRKITPTIILVSLSPFISLGLFYLGQAIFCGGAFKHQAFAYKHFALSSFFEGIYKIASDFLWGDDYYIFSILLLIGIIVLLVRLVLKSKVEKIHDSPLFVSLLSIIAAFILVLSIDTGVLDRYFDPIKPLIVLICLYPLSLVTKKFILVAVPLCALLFIPEYYKNSPSLGNGDVESMEYTYAVNLYQQAAEYLEKNHKGKKLFVPWPLNHVFQSPFMGYVEEAFPLECQQPMLKKYQHQEDYDLFVWASNSDYYVVFDKERFVKVEKLNLVKRIEIRGRVVEIYSKMAN